MHSNQRAEGSNRIARSELDMLGKLDKPVVSTKCNADADCGTSENGGPVGPRSASAPRSVQTLSQPGRGNDPSDSRVVPPDLAPSSGDHNRERNRGLVSRPAVARPMPPKGSPGNESVAREGLLRDKSKFARADLGENLLI